jgi:putative flippase GtrA
MIVNMVVLTGLTRRGLGYLSAGVVAVQLALTSNFILNEFWSFADFAEREASLGARFTRYLKFNLFCLGGAALNLVALWTLTATLGLHYLISHAIGIVAATVWNYGFGANIVWESTRGFRIVADSPDEGSPERTAEVPLALDRLSRQTQALSSIRGHLWLGLAGIWLNTAVVLFVIVEVARIRTPITQWMAKLTALLTY